MKQNKKQHILHRGPRRRARPARARRARPVRPCRTAACRRRQWRAGRRASSGLTLRRCASRRPGGPRTFIFGRSGARWRVRHALFPFFRDGTVCGGASGHHGRALSSVWRRRRCRRVWRQRSLSVFCSWRKDHAASRADPPSRTRDLLPRRARGARTTRRLARAIHRRSARAAHQSSVPFAPAPSAAESVAREPRLPAAAVAASTSLFSITTSVTLAKLPARSSRAREGEREGKEREYRAPDGGA